MTKQTTDQVLSALVDATGSLSERLATIEVKRFTDTVAQYATTSKAFWAAVKAYAPNDVSRKAGDQEALDAIEAACKAAGLSWGLNSKKSASTVSRLRTMRFHTTDTLAGFALYCGKQKVRQEIGQYVSYLGKLNFVEDGKVKPLAKLDGTLTNKGRDKAKAVATRKATRKATRASGFDFNTFAPGEDAILKAAKLKTLIHDATAELEALMATIAEADQAKVSAKFTSLMNANKPTA